MKTVFLCISLKVELKHSVFLKFESCEHRHDTSIVELNIVNLIVLAAVASFMLSIEFVTHTSINQYMQKSSKQNI